MSVDKPKKDRNPPKKRPRNLSPASEQRYELEALLENPDQEIIIPSRKEERELLPPDVLLNIQGSSAGAGSGEFHVYKAARKREFERIRRFEDEVEREASELQFLKERDERARIQAEKTVRNRKRRDKKKAKRASKENGEKDGDETGKLGLKIVPLQPLDGPSNHEDNLDAEDKEAPEGLLVIEED